MALRRTIAQEASMDNATSDFVCAGTLEDLRAEGRLVVHGRHRPVLLVQEGGQVFALDNRCPHMGFPLDRGSVEDGILTCHWHHARFELASGCTFDLWADDVPTCPVEIRAGGEIWVKPVFGYADAVEHWRQRLEDGLGHNLSLVIAKAVHGQLAAGGRPADVVRQIALFGTRNRDGWDTGLTILSDTLSGCWRWGSDRVIGLLKAAVIPSPATISATGEKNVSEPISTERFAVLAERAGLKLTPEQFEELRQGHRFVERMVRTVRRQPRDRAAEPAHIFVQPTL